MKTAENEQFISPDLIFQEDDEPPEQPPSALEPSPFISGTSVISPIIDFSVINSQTKAFIQTFFPGVTVKEWNNWHWQLRNSVKNIHQLQRFVSLTTDEMSVVGKRSHTLPLRITPWYLSLIDLSNQDDPLRKTMVPVFHELITAPGEASDPLSEENTSPVSNLVHRYPDRVLFLSTGFCAAYCRYCTRSHMVAKDKCHIGKQAWEPGLQYIENHTEIRDVIISGGDPLTMPDLHIEYLLQRLRRIPHIEIIRIGTKVPVVMPQRITKSLVNMLKKYHPLFMSIHVTHPHELMPEVVAAFELMANAGIPMGSQTVLLKGVNDDAQTMKQLMHGLLKARVRPYYLYQCDPIPGSAHFRTSISKGLEIIHELRGFTSGYAVPQYVIDAPGGGGKIPLLPEYFQGYDGQNALLENYLGKRFHYPDTID